MKIPKMRKLKLHIGLPKTGSSSIQSFLHLNVETLSKQGIVVPNIFGEPSGHTSLAAYGALATGLNFSPFVRNFHKLNTEADIEPFKKRFEKRFEACLLGHETKTFVMTTELFFTSIREKEQLQALKTFLDKYFSKIEIIAYVRSQEDWISSRLSQTVKLGKTVDVSRLVNTRLNDYYGALKPWWETFGWSHFHLRVLEKAKLVDNDLMSDFLHLIEAHHVPEFIMPERQNQALSVDAIDFLQTFNKHVPYFLDDKSINPERNGLTEYMEAYSASSTRHQLPKEQIESIRRKFEPSNEKLRSLFFPRYDTLFKYKNIAEPNDGQDDIDPTKVSAYLWGQQKKKLSAMKDKIEYLETTLETRIREIERESDAYRTKIVGLEDANLSLVKKLSGVGEDLKKQISQIESANASLDEKFTGVGGDLEKQISQLEGANASLDKKLSGVNDDLDKKISKIDGANASLDKKLSGVNGDLEKKISKIDGANKSLKKKITSLEKQGFLDLLLKDSDMD